MVGTGTTYAAAKLIRGEEFAQVGMGSEAITISRVIDGKVTCYVTRSGKTPTHSISCVK